MTVCDDDNSGQQVTQCQHTVCKVPFDIYAGLSDRTVIKYEFFIIFFLPEVCDLLCALLSVIKTGYHIWLTSLVFSSHYIFHFILSSISHISFFPSSVYFSSVSYQSLVHVRQEFS